MSLLVGDGFQSYGEFSWWRGPKDSGESNLSDIT